MFKDLNYKIVKSGSSGNCVIIENMMFDIGVSFNSIRKKLYDIKYLFITHKHTDHLNVTTFHKIKQEFPRIKTIANWEVAEKVAIDYIIGDESMLTFDDMTINSFPCVHDVVCHGFTIKKGDLDIIYATDTTTLDFAPNRKYDYFFIESNHDENKIKQIQNNSRKLYGYNAWEGAMRHFSTQKSKAFYYLNRKSKESEWIELHKSGRFY